MQRRPALAVRNVRIDVRVLQQPLDDLDFVLQRQNVQRGARIGVLQVDIATVLQQHGNAFQVTCTHKHPETI